MNFHHHVNLSIITESSLVSPSSQSQAHPEANTVLLSILVLSVLVFFINSIIQYMSELVCVLLNNMNNIFDIPLF